MNELTRQQARLWAALQKQEANGGVKLAELARDLGIHIVTLSEHLQVLAKKGYLDVTGHGRGRSPSVRLLRSGVPLIGYIQAGSLAEALEYPEGYLRLPYHSGKFGLRVEGNSMADAIQDGDVVVLQKRPYKSGEVCAVRVDNSDATLKYLDLYLEKGTALLRPHNPAHPTLELETHRIAVDGVFAGLLRGDLINDMLEGNTMN